jgi:hypothetical protein
VTFSKSLAVDTANVTDSDTVRVIFGVDGICIFLNIAVVTVFDGNLAKVECESKAADAAE